MSKSNGEINGGFITTSDEMKYFKEIQNNHSTVEIKKELQSNGKDHSEEVKENNERPVWSNSIEFLMSCISMSVGLGNIWRFPFTAYENGGGAFLIPYIVVLLLIGKPMYYLEMALGQFTSRGSVKIWEVCPAMKGIGIGQIIATCSVISYYCGLIALTIYYLISSFSAELPWSNCLPEWGTQCVDSKPTTNLNMSFANETKMSSSELFFLKEVLKQKNDISDGIGLPDLKLTGYLFLAWSIIFIVIVRGVKSSGKAAYFLAIFPYVVIITLLIHSTTLDGAIDGILFFIKPQWSELLNPKVWKEAIVQCFFSLAVGLGPVIMLSSYNKFDHGIYRDAVIVTTLDTFTSLLGGITIFGILGNLAHNLGIEDIGQVVKSGTALAFISYPDAISKFNLAPQVFSFLFFFMLFVLGIGSVVALVSAVVTVICDQWPQFKFWQMAAVVSGFGFLSGLIYVTPGGQWMLNLVDFYGGTFLIFVLAIIEMVIIFWVYGLENFCLDLEFMSGRKVTIYWRLCWSILTPGIMIIIFLYAMIKTEPLQYSGWDYPTSVLGLGWTLFAFGILQFPLWWAITVLSGRYLPLKKAFLKAFQPTSDWGPKDQNTRADWIKFKQDAKDRRVMLAEQGNHSPLHQKLYILLGKYD